jgi:hypothetical protein
MKTKTAATLTVKAPGEMTEQGRRDIATWLRRQATHLVRSGRWYSKRGRFTARFGYL